MDAKNKKLLISGAIIVILGIIITVASSGFMDGSKDVLCLGTIETERRKGFVEQGDGRNATKEVLDADMERFTIGADAVGIVLGKCVVVDFLRLV